MESRRQDELKMSYLREKISQLPHGKIYSVNGRLAVSIFYDPTDSAISTYNRKRYYLTSERGRFYKPLIDEYICLSDELKRLEKQWNFIYRIAPRRIQYPLNKRRYSMFDGDFFDRAVSNSNGRRAEHPIAYKGMILRSKNELIACQQVEKMGLEFKTEPMVGEGFDALYPDLIIRVPEQIKCIGLEIEGALDKERYSYKSRNRRKGYLDLGFQIGKDIVFLDIADPHQFYSELLDTQIRLAIEASLDDIIFPEDQWYQ